MKKKPTHPWTLIVILSYAGANEAVARHWPFWERTGCDILGVGREDTKCVFPQRDSLLGTIDIGQDGYVGKGDLPGRLVRLFEILTTDAAFKPYTNYFITEHDGVILGPLPKRLQKGMVTTRACARSPGFRGENCFHPPWWVDRETCAKMAVYGRRMLKAGLNEQGFPDRFMGLMVDLYGIPWFTSNTYTRNTLDREEYIQQARCALANGAWFIHGIKTEYQLNAVLL